jgi:hypothetical protein
MPSLPVDDIVVEIHQTLLQSLDSLDLFRTLANLCHQLDCQRRQRLLLEVITILDLPLDSCELILVFLVRRDVRHQSTKTSLDLSTKIFQKILKLLLKISKVG